MAEYLSLNDVQFRDYLQLLIDKSTEENESLCFQNNGES